VNATRALVTAVISAVLATGCYKRVTLTPPELARLSAIDGEALRVYVGRKLIVAHEDVDEPDAIEVANRKVVQETRRATIKVVIGRNTPGKIVGEDLLNGQRRLWVTFDPACAAPACAFAFVQNTVAPRSHDLTRAPAIAGYARRTVYWGLVDRRHRLYGARLRSLAEPNEVLARKRKLLETVRVPLVVKKRTIKRRDERVRRLRGID